MSPRKPSKSASSEEFAASGAVALISFGVSGALTPEGAPGELLLSGRVKTPDGNYWDTDETWRAGVAAYAEAQNVALRPCDFLGSEVIVETPADKAALAETSSCYAVDMESQGAASVAAAHAIPFLGLRAIADHVDQRIPPSARHGVSEDGDMRVWSVVRAALGRPSEFADLMRVGRDSAAATAALRSGVRKLFSALVGVM